MFLDPKKGVSGRPTGTFLFLKTISLWCCLLFFAKQSFSRKFFVGPNIGRNSITVRGFITGRVN